MMTNRESQCHVTYIGKDIHEQQDTIELKYTFDYLCDRLYTYYMLI